MATVSIVYHSGYGHTHRVAEAVERGAASVAGTKTNLIRVEDADQHWETLDGSDAIVFGAPTYMGSASAPFKEFQDKTSKIWYVQGWKDKIAGGFTNSGSYSGDKSVTMMQFVTLAMQQFMVWVGMDTMPGNNTKAGSPNDLNRVGAYTGLMTQSNVDEQADSAPPESDLKTAERYGARIAETASRWTAAKASSAE